MRRPARRIAAPLSVAGDISAVIPGSDILMLTGASSSELASDEDVVMAAPTPSGVPLLYDGPDELTLQYEDLALVPNDILLLLRDRDEFVTFFRDRFQPFL